jgi:hypothetical protein
MAPTRTKSSKQWLFQPEKSDSQSLTGKGPSKMREKLLWQKRLVLISFLVVFFSSCTYTPEETADEKLIRKAMESYRLADENGRKSGLLDVAIELEKILVEKKYLKSVSKAGYEEFYSVYVLAGSDIDIEELHSAEKLFLTLSYPSTLSRSWYILDELLKNESGESQGKSAISELHSLLGEMMLSTKFEKAHFDEYLRIIPNQDFENKDIYRVPLLVFLYSELTWGK